MSRGAQGVLRYPSHSSYLARGTSPLNLLYAGAVAQAVLTTTGFGRNNIVAYPLVIGARVKADAIHFEVTTGVATAVARVGLYRNTGPGRKYPSTLLIDSGEKDCSTSGVKSTTGLGVVLAPGLYWVCYIAGVETPTVRAILTSTAGGHHFGFASTLAFNGRLIKAQSYEALPATFYSGLSWSSTQALPIVAIHFSE